MGGIADGGLGGPSTKKFPSTEHCEHYLKNTFPIAAELLNYGSPELLPQLSLADAKYFDARLAVAARPSISTWLQTFLLAYKAPREWPGSTPLPISIGLCWRGASLAPRLKGGAQAP
jgi:hypothetical protein